MPRSIPGPADPARDRAGDPAELAIEVADLIHAVSRHIGRSAKAELGPLGVTWGQVRALRVIAGGTDPVRMGAIAERLGVVPRSATSVVDDLVEQGLAERTADPVDRRAVAVEVTAAGQALLADLADCRRSAAGEVLADLTLDELTTARDLLARTLRAAGSADGC